MTWIADLHIHSHFSIATSRELVPEHLDFQARRKGIRLIGSGDATHPGWLSELEEKLAPAANGLYALRAEWRLDRPLPRGASTEDPPLFMITTEISTIYKWENRVRKVHHLILLPDIPAAYRLQQRLSARGANITSDGRPILGMDSRDLLDIVLETDSRALFIPAHIWTPWFSALGARSGFDSIAECYRDLADHIQAVETGLSTDPPMHWICRHLDNYTLVSNSDAHSPDRIGRNAVLLDTQFDYDAVVAAIRSGDEKSFKGTIDLFPQEGKYHFDGHRKCGVCWDPLETLTHGGLCSKCGRPVTEGVLNRVAQLADRDDPLERPNRRPYVSIIPLREILGELAGVGPASRCVEARYEDVLARLGPEMDVLLWMPPETIRAGGFPELAEAIRRMRERRVYVEEGYDGQYGRVRLFAVHERPDPAPTLFPVTGHIDSTPVPRPLLSFSISAFHKLAEKNRSQTAATTPTLHLSALNSRQQAAVDHGKGPALVLAGPGSGKTRVLAERIVRLAGEKSVAAESILALTFARRAALSMSRRVVASGRAISGIERVTATTFHGLADRLLREFHQAAERSPGFTILSPEDRLWLLRHELGLDHKTAARESAAINDSCLAILREPQEPQHPSVRYADLLKRMDALDIADLPRRLLRVWQTRPDILRICRERFQWILVDEYQDVNPLQYHLIRTLAPDSDANLMVIGDPNQAIYAFRGADVRFIHAFQTDYPDAAVFNLAESYRCTDRILRASAQVVQANPKAPAFQSGPATGVELEITEHATERSEAEYVARTIEKMSGGLRFFSMDSRISDGNSSDCVSGLGDFAVLCRTRRIMAPLKKAFSDHAIPYQEVGNTPFFHEEPARSIIDLLHLGVDGRAELPRARLRTDPRFAGLDANELAGALRLPPRLALDRLWKMWFKDSEEHAEIRLRLLDIGENFTGDNRELLCFLAQSRGEDCFQSGRDCVTLMTLHAAKGLEFPVVFLPALERGIVPFSLYPERTADPAEERRLLYVGMTRASRRLLLSHANRRVLDGKAHRQSPSPFLNDLSRDLAHWFAPDPQPQPKPAEQKKLFEI